MIEFNQVISDKDYLRAIAIHYFGYKYTYISPVLGIILIWGLLIMTLGFPHAFRETPVFPFLLGAFLILRPIFYIQNVFRSIKSNKLSSIETSIKITDDEIIITTNNGNMTVNKLADLYSYYDTKSFLFLYLSRNQYLIIDKRQMRTNVEELTNTLDRLHIKKR